VHAAEQFLAWRSLNFCVLNSNPAAARSARLPERGTSGSVQRGPANPARPGREQRYRECLGCRRSPEVPRTGKKLTAYGQQLTVKSEQGERANL